MDSAVRVDQPSLQRLEGDLRRIKETGPEAWIRVRGRAEAAIEELEDRARQARQRAQEAQDAIDGADEDDSVGWAYEQLSEAHEAENRASSSANWLRNAVEESARRVQPMLDMVDHTVPNAISTLIEMQGALQHYSAYQAQGRSIPVGGALSGGTVGSQEVDLAAEIQAAVEALNATPGLRPADWARKTSEERAAALQTIADLVARQLGFVAPSVVLVQTSPEVIAEYDDRRIAINQLGIDRGGVATIQDVFETVDSLLHELRHAFQEFAAFRNPAAHPQAAIWRENLHDVIAQEDDPVGYEEQPIEADAREFARGIVEAWRRGGAR